jgi:hypothetical protein
MQLTVDKLKVRSYVARELTHEAVPYTFYVQCVSPICCILH